MVVRRRHGPHALLRLRGGRAPFPSRLQAALEPFGADYYPRFKRGATSTSHLKHRGEPRGIGGIFFDDLAEREFEFSFALRSPWASTSCRLPADRRERQGHAVRRAGARASRLYRRGRYVEFNLVYDRGTLFGLQSGGRTESILMSLPPRARWR